MRSRLFKFATLIGTLSSPAFGADTKCNSGIDAFSANIHNFVRSSTPCVGCHGGFHPSAPAWAAEDVEESYHRVKGFVDFRNPKSSKIVVRSNNGHCGPACQNNTALQEELTTRIKSWWDNGEAQCIQGQLAVLNSIPQNTAGNFVPVEWNLNSVANLHDGLKLHAELKAIVDESSQTLSGYVVRNLRLQLINPANSIKIAHLRLAINDVHDDLANQFEGLNLTVTGAIEVSLAQRILLLRGYDIATDKISARVVIE